MAGKKQLPPVRAVRPDDVPVPPLSLVAAFDSGQEVAELRAKRRILIAHIENENTLARDLAALMRQDNLLAKQIASIESAAEGDDIGKAAVTPDEAWGTG